MNAIVHHRDCDGWILSHSAPVERVSREGRGMWQARCECGWTSFLVGPDALDAAKGAGAEHTRGAWRECVGECHSWS